jgi:capsular exopolysaccharide synthesis family protein
MLLTSQPSNPLILSLNQRLMSLKASIFAAIQNQQSDLRFQLQRIEGQYGESIARLRSVPTQERALLDKSREQSIIEGLYTYLLQKREETALSLIGISSNSLVIDPPRSSVMAVSPNPLIYYFGGGVFGFFLPFLLISLSEVFKDVVQSEEDVKEQLPNLAIIGMVNESKSNKKQIVFGKNRSLVSDRFRSLRTNLQFLNGNRSKSIMVTSSVSGEGKTFVAANLAASFAAAEERTLIIDFDLRNQSVGKYLGKGKENPIGLSTYFKGESENLDELISATRIAHLDHLPSGPMPAYPDELVIDEDKLALLFGQLKDRYSTIVIDTSPVGIITDAILLNNHIDHSLFIVRMGTTKKDMLEKARDIFDQDLLVNPMLVLNGMKKGEVYGYKIK